MHNHPRGEVYTMRYFIGFLITIGLIVLLIVLLFHHGGKPPVAKQPLISYANTDTVVRMTIDGMVNDPQDHRQVQITVGRDSTTFQILQGYDGDPLTTQTYPMTEAAYDVFLHALQHAGYTLGNDNATEKDERGYCPLGQRYVFEVDQGGSDLQRYWITSCGGSAPSTFKGKTTLILQLFERQVPDYNKQTANVSL